MEDVADLRAAEGLDAAGEIPGEEGGKGGADGGLVGERRRGADGHAQVAEEHAELAREDIVRLVQPTSSVR